jgi:hypothetical protein
MRRAGVLVLLLLMTAAPSAASESNRRLLVEYRPPYLWVDARGVALGQVLQEIAVKVGFKVVQLRPSGTEVNVSIRKWSVEETLRHILRMDDHALVYRNAPAEGSTAPSVERIILWGEHASQSGVARAEPPTPALPRVSSISSMPLPGAAPGSSMNHPPVVVAPRARDLSAHLSPTSPPSTPTSPGAGQPDGPSASDLLAQRALVAATAAAAGSDMSNAGSGMPGASAAEASPIVDLHSALATTTRAAQRDVKTLVEALTQATASLGQPMRPPRR